MSPTFSASAFGAKPAKALRDALCRLREEALECLAGEIKPELVVILSDINMPGMDGLTLLGEVKRSHPDLPGMMITARGDDQRRRCADEPADFLIKPADFDQLKDRLRPLPTAPD